MTLAHLLITSTPKKDMKNYLDLNNSSKLLKIKKKKLKVITNDYSLFTKQCRSIDLEVINFNNKPSVVINYIDYPLESEVLQILTVECIKLTLARFTILTPKKKCNNVNIIYDIDPAIEEVLWYKPI